MLKALFRKQMMELNTWLYQDKKTGKRRSTSGLIMYIILYLFIFGMMFGIFAGLGIMLCKPMVDAGVAWLYFSMMGLVAVTLGVFGSVFNTFATLYKAKDNEMLMSLPIPASYILLVRLFGVWFWGTVYESLVFLPAIIVYWIHGSHSVGAVISGCVMLLLLSVLVLSLSCILGWIVAQISAKIKHKSFVTVAISILFFAGYYYVYFKAYSMLQSLLLQVSQIGERVKGAVYPLYIFGMAGLGNVPAMFGTAVVVIGLFAIIYLVLSRSFFHLASSGHTNVKAKYDGSIGKQKSLFFTMLLKEKGRFVSSANYMLNCGLGTVVLLVSSVAILIKGSAVKEILAENSMGQDMILVLACAGICFMAAMNDITAPSVSLEGKNLWIIKSLPIPMEVVLKAKIGLHMIVTGVPVLICCICLIFVLRPGVLASLVLIAASLLFTLLSASFGLAVGLKMPNLTWTDETVPIKQSMSVILAMFGSWIFVMGLVGLYFVLIRYVGAMGFLWISVVLLGVLSGALLLWILKRGAKILEHL